MAMDQGRFWQIIERARQGSGDDLQRLVRLVEEQLSGLPLEAIETFERIYQAFHQRSYNLRLWRVMLDRECFVSDDTFHSFRSWLISRGEGVFYDLLRCPERISEFVIEEGWCLESLDYAAYRVYKRRTGQILWNVLKGREAYPLVGYDWLCPDTITSNDLL